MKENFPLDGEAYVVGEKNGKYFFTWGPIYPYSEELPHNNVADGASGIEWYHTEEDALSSYLDAVEAAHSTFDSPIVKVMTAREAEERWGLKTGTIRNSCSRGPLKEHLADGHVRKSAGTWLVTEEIMKEIYGEETSE